MQRGPAAQLMLPQQTSFLFCFYLDSIWEILPTAALCVTLSDHTSYYVNYVRPLQTPAQPCQVSMQRWVQCKSAARAPARLSDKYSQWIFLQIHFTAQYCTCALHVQQNKLAVHTQSTASSLVSIKHPPSKRGCNGAITVLWTITSDEVSKQYIHQGGNFSKCSEEEEICMRQHGQKARTASKQDTWDQHRKRVMSLCFFYSPFSSILYTAPLKVLTHSLLFNHITWS